MSQAGRAGETRVLSGFFWAGVGESVFVGVDDGLDAVAEAEFHQDAFDVGFDG